MRSIIILLLVLLVQAAAAGQTFGAFLRSVAEAQDSTERSRLAAAYLRRTPVPVVEGTTVTFLYAGAGSAVSAPSELNSWDPSRGVMTRIEGTDLFYRRDSLPADARLEYKIWVDSAWILDPLNPRRAGGGYGENSDLWMPSYVQSVASRYSPDIRRGTLDTMMFRSAKLRRSHAVMVYTPAGASGKGALPVLYVTDGGDYLRHGRLDAILDNLIAARKITPLVAVFIEPRSDDAGGDHRMTDYAGSDAFLDFLEFELAPAIEARYRASTLAEQRVILGASMGALEATYAVLRRPGFISNCAAQSPAYLQADSLILRLSRTQKAKGRYFYIDAGTIGDTEREATLVARALKRNGAVVRFSTHHEGHNWTNWRARLPEILGTFFPRK